MPNAPRTAKSYTAVVEIQEVSVTDTNPGYSENKTVRNVSEVARLVLRADTVLELRDKLTAHINLIEE